MSSYYITNKNIDKLEEINLFGKHYGQSTIFEKFNNFNLIYNYSKFCEPSPGILKLDNLLGVYIGHFFNTNISDILKLYKIQGPSFIKQLDGEFSITIVDTDKNIVTCGSDTFFCRPTFIAKDGNHIGIASLESFLKQHQYTNIYKKEKNVFYTIAANVEKTSITLFDTTERKDSFNDWNVAFEKAIEKRIAAKPSPLICLSEGNDSGSIACYLNNKSIKHSLFTYIYPGSFTRDIIHKRHGLDKSHNIKKPHKSLLIPKLSDKTLNSLIVKNKHLCGDYEAEYYLDSEIYVKGEEAPYGERPLTLKKLKVDVRYTLGFYYSQYLHSILPDDIDCWLTGAGADFVANKYLNIYYNKYNTVDLIDVPEETYYNIGITGRETMFVYCDKHLFQEFLWLKKDLYKYNKQPMLTYCIEKDYPVRKTYLEGKSYKPLGFSLHAIDKRFIDNCYLEGVNLEN